MGGVIPEGLEMPSCGGVEEPLSDNFGAVEECVRRSAMACPDARAYISPSTYMLRPEESRSAHGR